MGFFRSSHTSDLEIDAMVATVPGACCYRVSTKMSWLGESVLSLNEITRLTCNLYLSVAEHTTVYADPSLRYASMLLGCRGTNKQRIPPV